MENKEIVKQDAQVPATIAQMDEFQPYSVDDTIKLPRLILAQGGRNNQIIKDDLAKDGELVNSLSKENYGKEIEIIPLLQKKSSRIRWKARTEGGGILCIARDGEHGQGDPGDSIDGNLCSKCPYFQVRKGQGQADDKWCSQNYEIIALVRASKEPIILAADSIKPADAGIRDMLGMARLNANKGYRMYQKSYILRVKDAEANGYNFFKLACVPGNSNLPLPQEEFEFMLSQSNFFKGSHIEADIESKEGDVAPW